MSRYRLSSQANDDIEGIALYIGGHNPEAACRVIDRLFDTFEFLGVNPISGTDLAEIRDGLRCFVPDSPASNYIIFFYPQEDKVEISDVIHGARDWVKMLKEGRAY